MTAGVAALASRAGIVTLAVLAGCGDDGPPALPVAVAVRASGCSLVDELSAGFVVGDGLVLTVAHALRGASSVSVDGIPGDVVALDHRIDAALIAADLNGPAVAFSMSPTTGLAWLPDGAIHVTDVVDANIDEPRDQTSYRRRALVLDADVGYGESGSPVLHPDGTVLGMVFATSTGRAGVAYAVAASELVPFVAGAGEQPVDTGEC